MLVTLHSEVTVGSMDTGMDRAKIHSRPKPPARVCGAGDDFTAAAQSYRLSDRDATRSRRQSLKSRSSIGKSGELLSRGLQVRVLPGLLYPGADQGRDADGDCPIFLEAVRQCRSGETL